MQYNPYLSNQVNADIYVSKKGAIYLQIKTNQYYVGSTSHTSLLELRSNVEKYI